MAGDDGVSLLEGLATTRTIHRYRPDPVPDHDLATILWSATRAPSGSNSQPFRFVVLRQGERARRARALLAGASRAAWAAKVAHDGWDRGSALDPTSRKARAARAMEQFVEGYEDIPVVVLVCALRTHEPHPVEGASVYPACQNLLLAARALGYGGCLSIWHLAVEQELKDVLGIPDDVWVAATVTLGRPEGRHGPVRRLPLADVVSEDQWGRPPAWAVDPPGSVVSRSRAPRPPGSGQPVAPEGQ